ncbi:MAG: hypothetical protein NZ699_16155 [Roseiflexus sp.]|nr:hypothetical protein [Roseiflexus sp.]MDW8145461.1 hypothetical protein [Roseiflexaceae bacterium]
MTARRAGRRSGNRAADRADASAVHATVALPRSGASAAPIAAQQARTMHPATMRAPARAARGRG